MVRIDPFRAWRYNPTVVRLEDLVPSPYNLVRIILGLPETFDAEEGKNVYTRAGQ
jgi:hypothetical protein